MITSGYLFTEILFDTTKEAYDVIDKMKECIDTYGCVTVADLYDFSGLSCPKTYGYKYGWTHIYTAVPEMCIGGYALFFDSKPIAIDMDVASMFTTTMLTKETKEYIKHNMETLHTIMDRRINEVKNRNRFGIKKVIFNDPATIVFWTDGSKTVVKCGDRDIYDPEKGLAMAISKKALGNQGNYYNVFSKHLGDYEEPVYIHTPTYNDILASHTWDEALENLKKAVGDAIFKMHNSKEEK